MNKVILMGNIARELELKKTQSNKDYLNFSLAINEGEKTLFVDCTAWEKTAQFIEKFFDKGSKILIEGKLTTSEYEKNGQTIKKMGVTIFNAEFCESKKEEKPTVKIEQDNLPFY